MKTNHGYHALAASLLASFLCASLTGTGCLADEPPGGADRGGNLPPIDGGVNGGMEPVSCGIPDFARSLGSWKASFGDHEEIIPRIAMLPAGETLIAAGSRAILMLPDPYRIEVVEETINPAVAVDPQGRLVVADKAADASIILRRFAPDQGWLEPEIWDYPAEGEMDGWLYYKPLQLSFSREGQGIAIGPQSPRYPDAAFFGFLVGEPGDLRALIRDRMHVTGFAWSGNAFAVLEHGATSLLHVREPGQDWQSLALPTVLDSRAKLLPAANGWVILWPVLESGYHRVFVQSYVRGVGLGQVTPLVETATDPLAVGVAVDGRLSVLYRSLHTQFERIYDEAGGWSDPVPLAPAGVACRATTTGAAAGLLCWASDSLHYRLLVSAAGWSEPQSAPFGVVEIDEPSVVEGRLVWQVRELGSDAKRIGIVDPERPERNLWPPVESSTPWESWVLLGDRSGLAFSEDSITYVDPDYGDIIASTAFHLMRRAPLVGQPDAQWSCFADSHTDRFSDSGSSMRWSFHSLAGEQALMARTGCSWGMLENWCNGGLSVWIIDLTLD